jgi:gliding motility-associated-like protein
MLIRLALIIFLSLSGIMLTSECVSAKSNEPAGFSIDSTDVHITMPSCRKITGSVKGLKIINPDGKQFTYSWKNASGTEVGTDIDLTFKGDGVYTLTITATDGSGIQTYGPVRFISTPGVVIDSTNVRITPSVCGQATGGVSGITATGVGTLRYSWTDVNGIPVSSQRDISGLPAGAYLLGVVSEDGFCGARYGPITISNTGGPVVDETALDLFNSDCQNRGGHIKGIKVTGTGIVRYEWLNNNNEIISREPELLDVRAGVYQLRVFDEGGCGPSFSKPYSIAPSFNLYVLHFDKLKVNPTTCDELGSVTGLKADSPINWRWVDEDGNILSETNELHDARGGLYKLIITTNCVDPNSNTRQIILFNLGPKRVILPIFPVEIKGTCVGTNTGSIKITGNDQVVSYKWFDANNQPAGTGNEIKDLAGGNYSLYLIDTMGCDKLYKTYTVPSSTGAQVSDALVNKASDECNTAIGAITGVKGAGGIAPYTYHWAKADGSPAGDEADLSDATAGDYTVYVRDASGCDPASKVFTVTNSDLIGTPLLKNKIDLCYPTQISLKVENVKPKSTYRLYDSNTAAVPIDEQASGIFSILPTESKIYYVSRMAGACESDKAAVTVNVALSSFEVANTFSPNNDGINDTWTLKGLKNNSTAGISVFNREGQLVFQSKGYAVPFDGTRNGKLLPTGVYYYIIDLKSCNVISGNLTLLR